MSIHELALLYQKQELYDRSAPLLEKAIKGRRLRLDDTHPHKIDSMNQIIDLYEAWDEPEEAREW